MKLILNRRDAARLVAVALASAGVGSSAVARDDDDDDDDDGLRQGKLFMITNAMAGNEVLVMARAANGPARLLARVATQGLGTGAGLGSQAAVALSGNGRSLFVVNAASNTVSTFAVGKSGLVLTSVVDSRGLMPISVAENDGLVYVLNAKGSGNVAGFSNRRGVLSPLADGVRPLSVNAGAGAAQVGFDNDGDVLVVSEKTTSKLTSYSVRRDGTLGPMTVTPSAGSTPFGFAITKKNVLVVSEAAGSTVSSYRLGEKNEPAPQLVSASVANGQAAACWIAVTPNGRYAYSANAGSSSISSFAVDGKGALTLLAAQAGLTSGNGVLDLAVTPDGKQLHAFASRAPQQIVSFTIAKDGSLSKIGTLGGVVPGGAAGLVAN